METQPMDIHLHAEKLPGRSPLVNVTANGKQLFPEGGGKTKEKLKADFQQKWPFRGIAKGIDQPNFFEIQPKGMTEEWLPAIKVLPRKDSSGKFEARVWFPGPKGTKPKEVDLPVVELDCIREQESKKPLEVPKRELILDVSKDNPLKESTLSLIDERGSEDITHFFARPTPPPTGAMLETMPAPNCIYMEVNKERTKVKIEAGHDAFIQYRQSECRAVSAAAEKQKMTWVFEIGPKARHNVTVEKRYKSSRITTLTVDHKVLIECAAGDLDLDGPDFDEASASPSSSGDSRPWTGAFRLIGERSVKAKVYEQTKDGTMLDSTDLVEVLPRDQIKYTKNVRVTVPDPKDFRTAVLDIDGVEFAMLKHASTASEAMIECEPEVLKMQYGIPLPTKVKDLPPTAFEVLQSKLQEAGQTWQEGWAQVQAQPGLTEFGNQLSQLGSLFKKS
uniref:Uncharacterized protein n=1 Tax=Alexandrium catenella TaxID=2925 RepID=A0A7S1MC60_ALECA